jgi:hypothetical protein
MEQHRYFVIVNQVMKLRARVRNTSIKQYFSYIVALSFIGRRNRRKPLIFCSSTDILHHKEQEKTTDLLVLLFYHYVPNFYVSGTAEDQWFSPVPCDEVCQ